MVLHTNGVMLACGIRSQASCHDQLHKLQTIWGYTLILQIKICHLAPTNGIVKTHYTMYRVNRHVY